MAHVANSSALADAGCIIPEIYKQNQNDDGISRHGRFDMLRREVAAIDGRLATARLPLGVESLDSALAGGLALGRVHMLCGRPGHDGALTGFAVALLRRILAQTDEAAPVVWCPAAAGGGSGMLYAAGLAALGLDPGRLLIVDSPSPGARLAALEDILRTEGLAAVIVEYDRVSQTSDYWMRLARRAQLAAEASEGGRGGLSPRDPPRALLLCQLVIGQRCHAVPVLRARLAPPVDELAHAEVLGEAVGAVQRRVRVGPGIVG